MFIIATVVVLATVVVIHCICTGGIMCPFRDGFDHIVAVLCKHTCDWCRAAVRLLHHKIKQS
jgi:hypothetical protein